MPMGSEYDVAGAFKAIEDELVSSMIRNMARHRAEETKEGYNWAMWQSEQLRALEKYKHENRERYGGRFRDINARIDMLIYAAREQGGTDQEQMILKMIKNGFTAKKASPGAAAEFFKLNERKLEALIKATREDMQRAETAVLRRANDQYRQVIFNAQVYANTGAGTYEKAVDMATKDFLKKGIDCIRYANGSRHTIADYADMAIRTAGKRAYLQGEGEKRQEWGISTVIVNKRGNPCPKCLPHCGKVYIDDVWSGGPKSGISPQTGIRYPLISSAVAGGLYHPRCKDSHTTYFEGMSTPPDNTYTRAELRQIEADYQREQKAQYAGRQAEKYGRLAEYSLDSGNKKMYQARADEWAKAEKTASDQIEIPSIFKNRAAKTEEQVRKFYHSLINVKNEDIYQLLRQSYERTPIRLSGSRRSYFSKKDKTVYLSKNADRSTIAHELFHEIDLTYQITENGALKRELEQDYSRLQKISGGKKISDMLYSKYPNMFSGTKKRLFVKPEYRGISDILNGMSDGKIDLGYYHPEEYWKKRGALQRETWAQCGRMYYSEDETVLQVLQELFPETTKGFERIIKEMIK